MGKDGIMTERIKIKAIGSYGTITISNNATCVSYNNPFITKTNNKDNLSIVYYRNLPGPLDSKCQHACL